MRIGCLQFAPKVGDVDNNLNRADAVLSRADVEELDLLVLPELAFTGYNFKSLKEIAPYLEPSGSGITSLWARTVALKYDCTVIAGYPEKVDVTPKWPTSPEYFNSAIVVSPDGETIANYRKSFLYYTDETWALEGEGFYSSFLPRLGQATLGICMDLNPYKFEAPWDDYEFAYHALDAGSNVVILSMAWMTREEPREFSRMPNEPDLETLTYWVTRLEPLIRADNTGEMIVVFANRCGIEGDATYAGTSAVLGVHLGEVTVYGLLGRGEKELLVVDTAHAPYGKLVYRPECLNKAAASNAYARRPISGLGNQDYNISDKESGLLNGSPDLEHPRKNISGQQSPQESEAGLTPIAPQWLQDGTGMVMSITQTNAAEDKSEAEQVENTASIAKSESESVLQETRLPIPPLSIPEGAGPEAPADAQTPDKSGTPVAPSQTLHSPRTAVRPKLVIPQSPTMTPQQLYPDQPASAASAMSGRSIQSIRSNDSEASIQTIRSNHRPPEDSTPYPHSGAPLSGYPQRKQIYGGFVAIRPEDQSFAPITPFDDLSPTSATWGWPQSANPFGSLNAAGAWPPPGTPLAIEPEPLPWSALRGLSRPRSRSTRRMQSNGVAPVRRPTPPVTGWSQPVNQPDFREVINDWEQVSKTIEKAENGEHDAGSTRPPSTKSRNASRSGGHGRPGSAMGKPDFSAAAQHLEKVAKRVSSVPCTKEKFEHSETESYFDDDSSSQSRDNSPAKVKNILTGTEQDDVVIPIVASPSLLNAEPPRHVMVPTPVAHDYYRSASNSVQQHATPSLSSGGARIQSRRLAKTQEEDSYDRAPSRGRQPGPKLSTTTPEHGRMRRVRSTSIDSTRNDLLHRHVRRPSTNGGSVLSRNLSRNTINGGIPVPEGYTAEDFERVEEIACPNCPVHGQRSSSTSNSVSNATGGRVPSQNRPRRRRSTSQNLGGSFSSPAPEPMSLPLRPAPVPDKQAQPRSIPEPRFAPAPVIRPKKGLHKIKRSFASSPVPRPSTAPLPFNPPTPKAMSFIPDVTDVNSPSADDLVLTKTIKGKFVDTQKDMGMRLPALAYTRG